MSYHVFFLLSTGIAKPIKVPFGLKDKCLAELSEVEHELKIPRETYQGEVRWNHWEMDAGIGGLRGKDYGIDDKVMCKAVERHNDHVRRLYRCLGECQNGECEFWNGERVKKMETLTPEDAKEFWFGLEELSVDPSRWTADYYRARMDHLYEVMRGKENEGVSFDAKALSPVQTAAVIRLFDTYLDKWDSRLDVPHGYDYLASSYDGGYFWCDKCFKPIHEDEWERHERNCRGIRKKKAQTAGAR